MSYSTDIRRLREQVGDLLASHEQTRDLTEFGKYADDPAGFMREVLRCEPWSMQIEMAERVRDNPRTVVVTCNGLGKDWATARIALWWAYARRGQVMLTGPTERQVKQILMKQVRQAFALAPELPGELYALELRIGNESGILAFTSDNPDRLTGYHHPRLLICITEGQGVDDEAYEAALACVTSPENRLFVYGNPTQPTGAFYRAATSDNWSTLTIAADRHPNVITGRNEIPGAVTREWVQMMADEYGEASPVYRSRVLAIFPEGSIEGLFQRDWLRAAFDRWDKGDLESQALAHSLTFALDVARYGADKSALAVIQGPVLREMMTWGGAAITTSVEKTFEHGRRWAARRLLPQTPARLLLRHSATSKIIERWPVDARELIAGGEYTLEEAPEHVEGEPWLPVHIRPAAPALTAFSPTRFALYVDEPGLGGGAIDVFRAKGWNAHGFNGAGETSDRRFLNLRAESHWTLRKLLEDGKIALPRDSALEEEALAIEWQINPASGKIQIVGKDLIRKALGRSPDRLDACVIGFSYSMGGLKRPMVRTESIW